jgi:uncharacterized protein (TIGR03083 family)
MDVGTNEHAVSLVMGADTMSSVGIVGLPGMSNDVWPLVHTERHALIDDLERLDEAQWAKPSLCDEWSVHDVVAHLVDVALTTRLGFVIDLARARSDFDRQNTGGLERARGATPDETLQRLRRVATRTSGPPAPLDTRIVEEVVHGEDIRRVVGLTRRYPEAAVVRSLRQQTRMPASFGGAKELVARVRLRASDLDLTIGEGPEIEGRALALLLAITGRDIALAELDGPGVTVLPKARKSPRREPGASSLT